MSQTNFRSDDCYSKQKSTSNKSIFDYMTDNSIFVNRNACDDFTPPFQAYIPTGTSSMNIDIENDLRGANRINTKCSECKFYPHAEAPSSNTFPLKEEVLKYKEECTSDQKILPVGYLKK
jgi:hypothetical protein